MEQAPRDDASIGVTGPRKPVQPSPRSPHSLPVEHSRSDATLDPPSHDPATFVELGFAELGDAASAPPLASAAFVLRIGPFRVVRVLGMGGMGAVYEAVDDRLERRVALKAIRPERRFDARLKVRFMREARILSSLDHPNICRIHDYLEVDDAAYLVLEFIEGEPLGRVRGRLNHHAKLRLAEQVAGVLVAAHASGVVHRDLKPDNILVTRNDDAKVLDFGIARATPRADGASVGQHRIDSDAEDGTARDAASTRDVPSANIAAERAVDVNGSGTARGSIGMVTSPGDLVGTPMYMSPEQARGEEPTPASDMYAFGLVVAELFSGVRPFDSSGGLDALLRRVERGERIPLQLRDRQLTRLVDDLTASAPSMRPTAADVRMRIVRLLGRTRRRVLGGVVATVALLAIGGSIKYAVDLQRERTAAVAARDDAEDLIGFMTQELRDRLAPVGRLDVLGGVAERVITYYVGRDPETLSDAELYKYARGLSLMGEVQLARSDADPGSAERAFVDAQRLLERLVAHDPTAGDRLKSLGAARFWIGTIAFRRMDLDRAQEEYEAYLEIAQRLVALDPESAEWQLELAYAQSNLVHLFRDRGDHDASRRALDASLKTKRRVVSLKPDDGEAARSLANGLSYLASLHERSGGDDDVAQALDEALDVLRGAMERSSRDTETAYRLTIILMKRGEHFERCGDATGALPQFREAQDIARSLLERDPSNGDWQREMAVTHSAAGRVLAALNRLDDARLELAASRRLLSVLVERDPRQSRWRFDLATTELTIASTEELAGVAHAALEAAVAAHARFTELIADVAEPVQRESMALDAAQAILIVGRVRYRQGEIAMAQESWSTVPPLIVTVEGARHAIRRDLILVEAYLRLERVDAAREPYTRLSESAAFPPDLIALAIEKGLVVE